MRVGSLFAGVGGFDLAAERAGMEVVFQSEVDPKASAVLDHHWPHVKNLGDVHGIADAPGVHVLTGGFPCQDYSVAGNRVGLAGDRGALWWEYHRLILELRPTWVVGENVPGLLSSRDGADFETIVGSLTECGYGVAWAVLDAQYFGVAQRRRRVFIVGHSGGEPRPEILALGEGLFGHPAPSRETWEDVAGTLGSLSPNGGSRTTDLDQMGAYIPVNVGPLTTHMASPRGSETTDSDHVVLAFAQNQRDEVRDLGDLAGGLQSEPGMKQQTYVVNLRGREGGAMPEVDDLASVRSATGGSSRSYVVTDAASHAAQDRAFVRRLTPLECERLQGFPDGWTDIPGNSDTQRYRQLGNAVAVPVVEWLMRRIVEVV